MDSARGTVAIFGDIEIRQAGPADLEAIKRFLTQAYGSLARYKAEGRWRWQFVDNPYKPADGDRSPVWLAWHRHQVVGQIAVQGGRFKIGGEIYLGGWVVDVMILPEFRGRQVGHRLYEAVARQIPLLLMLTMAPATRRMAARAGAATLDTALQFSRWTSLRPSDVRRYYLAKAADHPSFLVIAHAMCGILPFHWLASRAANIYLACRPRLRVCKRPELTITEIRSFGAETDAFWDRVSIGFHSLQVRDATYLNWRFRDCPDLRYRCFLATSASGVVGYSVLRHTEAVEMRQGIIAEVLVAPGDMASFRSLVVHAINVFGADVASVECVTSLADAADVLRRLGFLRTRSTAATCSARDQGPAATDAKQRPWLFTKGDHDWDQIHLG